MTHATRGARFTCSVLSRARLRTLPASLHVVFQPALANATRSTPAQSENELAASSVETAAYTPASHGYELSVFPAPRHFDYNAPSTAGAPRVDPYLAVLLDAAMQPGFHPTRDARYANHFWYGALLSADAEAVSGSAVPLPTMLHQPASERDSARAAFRWGTAASPSAVPELWAGSVLDGLSL